MRFSTVAILATGALASTIPEGKPHGHGKKVTTSTVYATIVKTISECPPTVTKCPHDKTKVVTETVSSFTTVCTVDDDDDDTYTKKPTVTSTGKPQPPKTTTPCDDDDVTKYHPGKPTGKPEHPDKPDYPDHPGKPKPEEPECKPVTKVKTITSSITTVIPTVIYKTEVEDCEKAKPTGGYGGPKKNETTGGNKAVKVSGAGSLVGSAFFAVAAGVAAFAFA